MQVALDSPLGGIVLTEKEGRLIRLEFAERPVFSSESPVLREAEKQLREYFAGKRKIFSLPLAPEGTPFQRAAWEALQKIPYGETRSYAWEAMQMGRPGACRAVGNANGKNPLPILIPCHRVIAADGTIGGYSSGVWRKEYLLALENE